MYAASPLIPGLARRQSENLCIDENFSSVQMFERGRVENRGQLRANIKRMLAACYSSQTAIVVVSHTLKQALLSTCINMWQLILTHLSEMAQRHILSA